VFFAACLCGAHEREIERERREPLGCGWAPFLPTRRELRKFASVTIGWDWKIIEERIKKKFRSWKGKHMSIGGD
jgi:hypothetical protein